MLNARFRMKNLMNMAEQPEDALKLVIDDFVKSKCCFTRAANLKNEQYPLARYLPGCSQTISSI
jgi:hypothetical protein